MENTNVESIMNTQSEGQVIVESYSDGSSNLWLDESTAVELNPAELVTLKRMITTHLEWIGYNA